MAQSQTQTAAAQITMDDARVAVGSVLTDGGAQAKVVELDHADSRIKVKNTDTGETYWTLPSYLTARNGRVRIEACC